MAHVLLNYVDLLLILAVLLMVLRGLQRGFLIGLLGLAGWCGSLLVALTFSKPAAALLGPYVSWSNAWDRPAAFLLIAIASAVLLTIIASHMLNRLPQEIHTSTGNRLLGLLPGAVNGIIFAIILATMLLTLPLPGYVSRASSESRLAGLLAAQTERFRSAIIPIFGEVLAQSGKVIIVRPEADRPIELPFTTANAEPRPDLEAKMLALINRERLAAGLQPLAPDPELAEVARAHSADMLARGYFGHTTPEGRGPFDRINAAGIPYLIAGENLAFAPILKLAHTGLMKSSGHRANILHPEFGRAGIGILDAGPRGLMITQLFRN
ncbi:MAG: hypothetical protein KatS3mg057_1304 [Herpetosiphonaceae bacterium]|nr:MAG: hypothetical protein KatS3mg057_1304 [Herpetosiphonaceae bacterium]